jgi:hypothetical protein
MEHRDGRSDWMAVDLEEAILVYGDNRATTAMDQLLWDLGQNRQADPHPKMGNWWLFLPAYTMFVLQPPGEPQWLTDVFSPCLLPYAAHLSGLRLRGWSIASCLLTPDIRVAGSVFVGRRAQGVGL